MFLVWQAADHSDGLISRSNPSFKVSAYQARFRRRKNVSVLGVRFRQLHNKHHAFKHGVFMYPRGFTGVLVSGGIVIRLHLITIESSKPQSAFDKTVHRLVEALIIPFSPHHDKYISYQRYGLGPWCGLMLGCAVHPQNVCHILVTFQGGPIQSGVTGLLGVKGI